MKRCSKRILAAVMCAAVLTVSAPITAYADSTLDHLNGQYSELEKQQQALKDKLNQTKTEKEKQEAIRNNLNNQITNTQKQITLLDNKINYLQNDIADKEERINELSAEVLEQQDLFMKRIRSIYKTSVGTSMLGMVFGVDSLGSYLSYGKYLSRISEHDSALLQALADNITELRTLQAQMQEEKEDLADTKVTAEGKKASLNSQKTEVESTLQDIKKMEQEYLADQAAIQKEMKQIQADIDAIYAANAGASIIPIITPESIFRHLPIRPFAPQPPAPSFMCVPVRVTAGHGATAIILSLTMAAVFPPYMHTAPRLPSM